MDKQTKKYVTIGGGVLVALMLVMLLVVRKRRKANPALSFMDALLNRRPAAIAATLPNGQKLVVDANSNQYAGALNQGVSANNVPAVVTTNANGTTTVTTPAGGAVATQTTQVPGGSVVIKTPLPGSGVAIVGYQDGAPITQMQYNGTGIVPPANATSQAYGSGTYGNTFTTPTTGGGFMLN